jgi:hypothetical protein
VHRHPHYPDLHHRHGHQGSGASPRANKKSSARR